MTNRWVYFGLLVLIVTGAVLLRAPRLAARPMHNDEAVNAVKFDELWRTGTFNYDPNEYHGPTLYYLTLPIVWLTGERDFAQTTEVTYRIVPLIFGVGLILLLPLVADGIGRGGVLWAALFTAVSPAMVFYGRYYIHEMVLVFFAFAAIACGWRYRRSGHLAWALACGAMVGMAYATKETWVIALVAAAGAGVAAATIWRVLLKPVHHGLHFRWRALAVAAAAFAVVFVIFFSGFFTRFAGVKDAIATYTHYAGRASGGVHDHPWNYYLAILLWWRAAPGRGPVWTEMAIVALAAIGFGFAVFRKPALHGATPAAPHADEPSTPAAVSAARWERHSIPIYPPFVRFMGFYIVFLIIGFSAIPYKTPWCMLGFLQGMIVLAGFACGQVVRSIGHPAVRGIALGVFLAAAAHLAWEADRATNNFAAHDPRQRGRYEASNYNPYVYAHTSNDIFTLTRRMDEIARVGVQGRNVYVQVVTADCWPIPFYLRSFPRVGYWATPPEKLDGDVIIGTQDVWERLNDPAAPRKYQASSFGLRPGVVLWIYVEQSLWDRLRELWRAQSGNNNR
ncbi:MAG TPA: flippase activity-associated protein Agl23 [Tepidisphaeraceae bacterium]